MEALAKLKPVFDRKFGTVTAGNSSQITDGAAALVLASERYAREAGLKTLGRIRSWSFAGCDPARMGLGPVLCATEILDRNGLGLNAIEIWELNEAFAAQVLGCLRAFDDPVFCKQVLGKDKPMGRIDRDRLNVDGGAVSLGHPVGASGNRIVLHLVNAMHRLGHKVGIATECIGGGQGGAMLVEAA